MPDKPIPSIHELVQELLRHRDPSLYAGILARYAVPGPDLEPYFRWNARHYTRTCIQRNEAFELLLICYEPGQLTSIHDYDSQMAWIHPVAGEVVEERYALTQERTLKPIGELHLRPGMDDRFTGANTIHRFTNRGPERAVTLNLYAKPMRQWRVYNGASGTASIAQAGPT